jgi:hypothetical protein
MDKRQKSTRRQSQIIKLEITEEQLNMIVYMLSATLEVFKPKNKPKPMIN